MFLYKLILHKKPKHGINELIEIGTVFLRGSSTKLLTSGKRGCMYV